MIKQLLKAIRSENIKALHTKSWISVLIFGGALQMLLLLFMLIKPSDFIQNNGMESSWFSHFLSQTNAFAIVFLSLGIVIFTAQVNSIEHRNNTWQLTETQPIKKAYIFLAKYLRVLKLLLAEIIAFYLIGIISALISYYTLGAASHGFTLNMEWGVSVQMIINLFFGASSFAALFFVLNINIKKTNMLTGLGLLTVIGFLISKAFFPNPSAFIPIVQLDKASRGPSQINEWITFYSRLSFVQSIFILIAGYYFYYYKHYNKLFFKKSKTLLKVLGIVIAGTGLVYYLHLPREQKSYGHTIIAGKINAEFPLDSILILGSDHLPLVSIPVNDSGEFHINMDKESVPKDLYSIYLPAKGQQLSSDGKNPFHFFLTDKDSVYITSDIQNKVSSTKSYGDRRAETTLGVRQSGNEFSYLQKMLEDDKFDEKNKAYFLKEFENSYNEAVSNINSFTTIDGLKLSGDIEQRNLTLLQFEANRIWNRYTYLSKSAEAAPAFIQAIEQSLNADDVSLISSQGFKEYVYAMHNDGKPVVNDLEKLPIAQKINNPAVKEAIYYDAIVSVLQNNAIADSIAIRIAQENIPQLRSFKYRYGADLDLKSRIANSNYDLLPNFELRDKDNNPYPFHSLQGKYVIIDVWASWCMPCKKEAPYFATLAEKYKDKNIQFVALCTDRNSNNSAITIVNKPHVLDLNTDWDGAFIQYFAIQGIPRFILIGPDGRPINHNMPVPSESNFEIMLNQYLK